ncbi:MAG TPA: hypothetical protein VH834_16265, partial [Solirubrobacteraceae bacterium]
ACTRRSAIGKVAGQDWGCPSDQQAGLPPCIISQGDGQLKASVTVFSVKGGGKVKIVKQRRSDGKWLITVIGGGELGAEFGSPGGRISVDTGDGSVGGGVGVEGGVVGQGEYGATWVFDDEKGANDAIDIVRNKLRDEAIDAAVPVIGSIGTHFFGEHRSLGDPDIEYIQGGVAGDVSGEAKALGGLDLSLEGSDALGVRWNHQNDTKTVYFEVKAKGSGSAKLIEGLGLEGATEGQIAVTYDKDGKAIAVDVIGKGTVQGTLPKIPTSPDPRDFLSELKFQENGGVRGEVQLHLDLTNPTNANAYHQFMDNPFGGADDLVNAFLNDGQAQVRAYSVSQDKYGLDVNGKFGLKFGIEGGYEGNRADLIDAWDWNPQQGWSPSATCKR